MEYGAIDLHKKESQIVSSGKTVSWWTNASRRGATASLYGHRSRRIKTDRRDVAAHGSPGTTESDVINTSGVVIASAYATVVGYRLR